MKKSKRFQVSERYAFFEPTMPMANILINISNAKKQKMMSSEVWRTLHLGVVQLLSSEQGWYIPSVIQLSKMAIMLTRSNHVWTKVKLRKQSSLQTSIRTKLKRKPTIASLLASLASSAKMCWPINGWNAALQQAIRHCTTALSNSVASSIDW